MTMFPDRMPLYSPEGGPRCGTCGLLLDAACENLYREPTYVGYFACPQHPRSLPVYPVHHEFARLRQQRIDALYREGRCEGIITRTTELL